MCNILQQILQLPKSLSYPFLERKSRKQELGVGIQNEQARRPTEPERSGDERESAVSDPRDLVRKSLPYPQPPMNASTDALSYPFLERKSEIYSVRGVNMQKRNVLRLCRLRVLRVLRGKKYRFSSATPIKSSHRCQKNLDWQEISTKGLTNRIPMR